MDLQRAKDSNNSGRKAAFWMMCLPLWSFQVFFHRRVYSTLCTLGTWWELRMSKSIINSEIWIIMQWNLLTVKTTYILSFWCCRFPILNYLLSSVLVDIIFVGMETKLWNWELKQGNESKRVQSKTKQFVQNTVWHCHFEITDIDREGKLVKVESKLLE